MNKLFLIYGLVRVAGVSLKTRKEIITLPVRRNLNSKTGKSSQRYTALLALDHFNLCNHIFTKYRSDSSLSTAKYVRVDSVIVFGQDWEATARKSPRTEAQNVSLRLGESGWVSPALAQNSGEKLAYSLSKYSLNLEVYWKSGCDVRGNRRWI